MKIEILGSGCPKCKIVMKAAEEAVKELGINAEIEKIEDITKIISYGVMITPAIVIDGKVVVSGRTPKTEEIKDILKKY